MVEELNQVEEVVTHEALVEEQKPQEQPQLSPEESRLEQLREQRKIQRARDNEVEEAYKRTQLDEMRRKPQLQQEVPEEEPLLGDDDLAEGKHLKRYAKKIKILEEKLRSYEQNTQASTAELHLRAQFPDFDKVVNSENIELLRDLEPDIAASINSNNDLYTKASSAYKLIKKLGIYREDTFKNERDHAYANVTKPRPLTSVSPQQAESPLARANAFANGLTDELKEQLRKEMAEVRRRN